MQEWWDSIDWFSTAFLAVGIFAGLMTVLCILQAVRNSDLEEKVRSLKCAGGGQGAAWAGAGAELVASVEEHHEEDASLAC